MHVVVVGGGIAGLAAAHHLLGTPGVEVTLLEADDRLGGKIRTEPFAGLALDTGPDAFLARRPEAVALCRELGLDEGLVAPATTAASLWVGRRLRPLPSGTLLGVPTDVAALARSRVLSTRGLARAAVEPLLPGHPLGADDAAVGTIVRRRFGREVTERLVDPLVGGINAGITTDLSVDAVAPQIAAAARRHRSLTHGAREVLGAAAGPGAPLFLTLPGGLGRLVDALAARLATAGATVRTATPVEALEPAPGDGWLVLAGDEEVRADAVVVAVPAFVAAPLLGPLSPPAAAELAAMEHASVALVAMAWPAGHGPRIPDGSGFLVPRPEGRLMTACSWASNKWRHLDRAGQVVVRLSAGRMGDDRAAAIDDAELVDRLRIELGTVLGGSVAPDEVHVARWPRGFPQYRPGHLTRMAGAVAGFPAGLALAGAALGGVGVPACIGSGEAAAASVLAELAGRPRRSTL